MRDEEREVKLEPVDIVGARQSGAFGISLTPGFFLGRKALMVGGGAVAERRVKRLLEAGATVRVIAPALTLELEELVEAGRLEWLARRWQAGDVSGCEEALLVFAATDDPAVNRAVAQEARSAGRLVNRADDPTDCDFTLPGLVQRGEITIAITTGAYTAENEGGASPALTAHLRKRLAEVIGPEYDQLARLMRELRLQVKRQIDPALRPALWRQMIASPALDLLRANQPTEARAALVSLLEKAFIEK